MADTKVSTRYKKENQGFQAILRLEKEKYQKKGWGLLVGLGISYVFYFIFPQIMLPLYEIFPWDNPYYNLALVKIVLYWIIHIVTHSLLAILYAYKIPYFEQYRVNQDPWPWESDPVAFKKLQKSAIKTFFYIVLVVLPLFLLLKARYGTISFKLDPKDFPTPFEMIWQMLFFYIAGETAFYWSHVLMHQPWFYKTFHKKHHEFKGTIGIAGLYFTTFDYLVNNITLGIGPNLLGVRCHMFTSHMWTIVSVVDGIMVHSGYDFPWLHFSLLPFSSNSNEHDFHHSQNAGNYASYLVFWDYICGTNKNYLEFVAKKKVEKFN